MFNIGEYVVYKRDVCKIKDIKEKYFNNQDYYVLEPINDNSLTIQVPINNDHNNVRSLLSKKEVEKIIKEIPNVPIIECHDRMIENEYKNLLNTESHLDLIRIIKTTYLRNKERLDKNKKIGDKDNTYFIKAETYLYNEFSIVLGKTLEETKDYIFNKVNAISKQK